MNPFGEFVFMKDGERINTNAIRKRVYLVCKKANAYKKSPHKIRKTYGSILIDNNVDSTLIIAQMGHADILCTEKHYHRNRKSNDKKANIISNIPELQIKKEHQHCKEC
ncbi:MAG: tyrosine-type recombinase/integrase [Lachnospiraceae bacterium]|nr:tyrosine-type recombinase/integrase [Lachnospiraceae bacterium]